MSVRVHPWLRGLGLGFTLGSAVFLPTGCEKRSTPESTAPAAVLRISQRNEPADLDPAMASFPDEFFIIRALGEGLLVPNPAGGEPLLGAAERFEVSADGLTYTFHLRPNAAWSNGEPVTADDFVMSYRRVLSPITPAPKAHLFFAVQNARAFSNGTMTDFARVGLRASDSRTLVVTLAHPDSAFPLYVASDPWIPVNPRTVAAHGKAWTEPANYVGNGPFVLKEWRPQQRIVVARNPRYHDAAKIRLDEIHFVRFDNKDAEERGYRASQIEVTMAVPEAKLDAYARDRAAELHRAPLAETRLLVFNVTKTPLSDVRVRRALSLAIDRDKLVKLVLHGGQEAAGRFLSPALLVGEYGRGQSPSGRGLDDSKPMPETDAGNQGRPEVGPYPAPVVHRYDPANARQLLAEAGFAGGKSFPRLELSGWDRNPVLEAMQQMWRQELGIEVSLAVRELKVHLAALHGGDFDIAFVTNLLDVRDATNALGDYVTGAPNNFPRWHSTEFERELAAAANSRSAADAWVHDLAAERLLLAAAPVAPVYFNTQNWLMSARIHGWEQDGLWTRRYNDVWLDK